MVVYRQRRWRRTRYTANFGGNMSNNQKKILSFVVLAVLVVSLIKNESFAAGSVDHVHETFQNIGSPGKKSKATRIVKMTMFDNYFQPKSLIFNEGETVRFIIKNSGEFVHEFNIGTKKMHKSHAPEMLMMMEHGVIEPDKINWDAAKSMQEQMGHGMHNEPNSVLLEPGKKAELVWTFPKHADLEFACNVPGHYESGMVGKIKLTH